MASRDESKADYWRRVIRRQGGSGLSVRAWCGRHDVSEASYWWRRRLGRSGRVAFSGCLVQQRLFLCDQQRVRPVDDRA